MMFQWKLRCEQNLWVLEVTFGIKIVRVHEMHGSVIILHILMKHNSYYSY